MPDSAWRNSGSLVQSVLQHLQPDLSSSVLLLARLLQRLSAAETPKTSLRLLRVFATLAHQDGRTFFTRTSSYTLLQLTKLHQRPFCWICWSALARSSFVSLITAVRSVGADGVNGAASGQSMNALELLMRKWLEASEDLQVSPFTVKAK